jgi:hypothetical protein
MSLDYPPDDPELGVLLERGRMIPRLPDVVRARSLARARATMAAGATPQPELIHPVRRRGLLIALAAALALFVVGAGAIAALGIRVLKVQVPASSLGPSSVAPARLSPPSSPALAPPSEESSVAPQPVSTAKRPHTARPTTAQESYAAELNLLHRAQAAYASRDYAGALGTVAEHSRRFPGGRLAEEREALRVRSLASAGRADEARQAATAFADRFPRSVLLPQLAREPRQ